LLFVICYLLFVICWFKVIVGYDFKIHEDLLLRSVSPDCIRVLSQPPPFPSSTIKPPTVPSKVTVIFPPYILCIFLFFTKIIPASTVIAEWKPSPSLGYL
jgi:hypothetical protein